MSGKVSIMSNNNASLMSRPAALALAIFMATGLAGCMSEDPSDVSFKPYSIDDRYPLGVAKTPVTARPAPLPALPNRPQPLA
jgi:type IV pilus biogenesis protein CpaD/CtpE